MQQRTASLWNLPQGCELIDLEGGYYVVRFFSREDYMHVLEGGPWIILGHYLTVTKWRPNFRPSLQQIHTTFIWVRFRELPLEIFDEETLADMSDLIGRTVKVDPISIDAYRGRYARVCVEIDLDKPLLPSITVFDAPQLVEYEGLHLICFSCGKYGHRSEACHSLPQLAAPAPPPWPPPQTGLMVLGCYQRILGGGQNLLSLIIGRHMLSALEGKGLLT